MSDLLASVKKAYFKPELIGRFLDEKTYRVLNRFGATVRKTAQYSMRKRKGAAPAGKPPHSHANPLLRKLLFYSFDGKKTVVIGPILKDSTKRIGVPRLMEEGGIVYAKDPAFKPIQKYQPHPFMKPAFTKHTSKVAEWYKS